jgi:CBS domain-containing protein
MGDTKLLVRDVMTPDPTVRSPDATVIDAAKAMRDGDFGAVLVGDDDHLIGIVTDRDIVVRALAEKGREGADMKLRDIVSDDLFTVSPDEPVEEAIEHMRDRALRRVPVVDGDKPVGIISIGDLAVDLDRDTVLGEISAAPPNN